MHSTEKGTKREIKPKAKDATSFVVVFFLLSLILSHLAPLVISFVLFACVGHSGGVPSVPGHGGIGKAIAEEIIT